MQKVKGDYMDQFFNDLKYNWGVKVISSFIVIIISVAVYKGIIYLLNKSENRNNSLVTKSRKGKTYIKLIRSIIRYIFITITVLILLQINGVDVSSMLAGVGIIGVIVGFAVQDALKDIIKGLDIISDSYYQVGDVIKYGKVEGKVLAVGLKTTKVEDVRTFNVISIANRNIQEVEVVSNLINIDVPMPYETKIIIGEKVMEGIVENIKKLEHVVNCEYSGINELADSSIKYQIKVYCKPVYKVQIKREALRCILLGLEKNNIQVPYNQIDVHQK